MNQNEFEYKGKTYVAVEKKAVMQCAECAFWEEYCMHLQRRGKIPSCFSNDRIDGKRVFFVEKGKAQK